MGIHYNHKSKAGDRKMEKELKRKMKIEARKQKKLAREQAELDELERLTFLDKSKKLDTSAINGMNIGIPNLLLNSIVASLRFSLSLLQLCTYLFFSFMHNIISFVDVSWIFGSEIVLVESPERLIIVFSNEITFIVPSVSKFWILPFSKTKFFSFPVT